MDFTQRIANLCFLWLLVAASSPAQAQEHTSIESAIDALFSKLSPSLPGQASYEIGRLASNPRFKQCKHWEASLPEGGRPWGKTTVRLSCTSGPGLSLYTSVYVRIQGSYIVTAQSIPANKPIEVSDLKLVEGELSALPQDIVLSSEQALGKSPRSLIQTGRPLRLALLRAQALVQAGQEVKIIVRGTSFYVSNTGKALGSAAKGETLRVRLQDGSIVIGTVSEKGVVEARF